MTTDTLIERLARELQPVRPLAHPGIRTVLWTAGALVYLTLVAAPLTSQMDIAVNGEGGVWFFLPQVLALLGGAAAAGAAFTSVIPGYSRRAAVVAVVATAAWGASLAAGAHGQWTQELDPSLPSEWLCVALIVASGGPLTFVMLRMLRKGAVFNPSLTAALCALAVTSLAMVGACFTHPHPNRAVTFVWHGATLLGAVMLFAVVGPRMLRQRRES